MMLRRIQFLAVVFVLFTFAFAPGAAQRTGSAANTKTSATADWTFEGCWTQFPAGPCRDVFRDQQGNYQICRACGTTGNPSPGKCSQISAATLASGFWCS
jgi:hypothetical protein